MTARPCAMRHVDVQQGAYVSAFAKCYLYNARPGGYIKSVCVLVAHAADFK